MKKISRPRFLATLTGLSSMFIFKSFTMAQTQEKRPDPLNAQLVQEFVRLGHFDLEGVKQKLRETPALLNATTDWGAGDFETALGGASHMGRKDIADFLIRSGARMDIFTAAMLGKLDLVQSMCEYFPELLQSKGPHGITLLMHAQKGGEESKTVVEYLNQKGITK